MGSFETSRTGSQGFSHVELCWVSWPRYEFILKEGDSHIVDREPCAQSGQLLCQTDCYKAFAGIARPPKGTWKRRDQNDASASEMDG